jgi:hypothetical protein
MALVTGLYLRKRPGGTGYQALLIVQGLAEWGHDAAFLAASSDEGGKPRPSSTTAAKLPGWRMMARALHRRLAKKAVQGSTPVLCHGVCLRIDDNRAILQGAACTCSFSLLALNRTRAIAAWPAPYGEHCMSAFGAGCWPLASILGRSICCRACPNLGVSAATDSALVRPLADTGDLQSFASSATESSVSESVKSGQLGQCPRMLEMHGGPCRDGASPSSIWLCHDRRDVTWQWTCAEDQGVCRGPNRSQVPGADVPRSG